MIQKLEFLRGLKGLLSLSPPGKGNLKRPGKSAKEHFGAFARAS
jgi:hypothetical protein